MNEQILAYRDEKLKIMADDPYELNHYATSDVARADDYAGREIFELLQNAIDYGNRTKVCLTGDTLVISNTGEPFGVSNIKSLMIPDNSTKRGVDGLMGCKGVGFRASLNISDDISVYSGEIRLNFSKENALKFQQEYNLDQMPPMMRCPVIADDEYRNEYTTNIVIKLRDDEQIERVRNQIRDISFETILFLKDSFENLTTEVDGVINSYSRSIEAVSDGEVLVKVRHNDELKTFREFYEDVELDNPSRRDKNCFRISAIYSPEPINRNKLFAYFQTDIDFPMDYWYVHGDFNLTNNRNYLVKDTFNRILMESLLRLVCQSAQEISEHVDYLGYRSLVSCGTFSDSVLEDADINDMLDELVSETPILPNVHGDYIALNSNPKFYDKNMQKYLIDMPGNDDLLQYTDDDEIKSFLDDDSRIGQYSFFEVCEYVKSILQKISVEDRAECALLLQEYYGQYSNDTFMSYAPNFFLDTAGNEIENGSILIESSDKEVLSLPAFVDLKYINEKQLDLVKEGVGCSNDDIFVYSSFALSYGIKIADINEILEVVDENVKKDKALIPDYIRWLFDNRDFIEEASHANYYILTKKDEIGRSDNSYFGKEYIKGSQLDKFYDSSRIIAEPGVFHIKPNELNDFTSFLKNRLKVADEPRNVGGSIDGLEKILKIGSTEYIIRLLCERSQLLKNYKQFGKDPQIIKTTPWITRKGKRYAPENVILTSKKTYHKINDHIDDDFLFISQDSLLSGNKIENSDKTWLLNEYLDMGTNLNDLNNCYIYEILNELPSFDRNGAISEDVYRDVIERNSEREKPSLSDDGFSKFVNSGKVYCLDKKYHDLKDCRYLEENYPNVISANYNCINIVKGKSTTAIWDRLHIDSLLIDYELHDYKKSYLNNTDHENNIKSIKTSLLVENSERFEDEELLKKLAKINIILCETVTIAYEGGSGSLEDYEFVGKDDDYYIKIPSRGPSDLKNRKYCKAISDIFKIAFSFSDKNNTRIAASLDMNSRIDEIAEKYGGNAWGEALEKLNIFSTSDKDYSEENNEILLNIRDASFGEYERRLYSKMINATTEEKESYVDRLLAYKNYRFDIDDIPKKKGANMRNYLLDVFPLFNEKIVLDEDIYKRRNDGYEKLAELFNDYREYLNRLLDNSRFESLLRFGELGIIREEMKKIIDRLNSNPSTPSVSYDIANEDALETNGGAEGEVNERADSVKGNRPIAIENHETASTDIAMVDFDDIRPKRQASGVRNVVRRQRYVSTAARRAQEERGKEAEKIALGELKKLGYSNIQWMSAYAKDEGVNPNGADGYGYDIMCEKDGSIRYVEVKSSASITGIEFEMSENEYNCCCQHPNNYDIFYVFAMNAQAPKTTFIDNVYYRITDENKVSASYRITLK